MVAMGLYLKGEKNEQLVQAVSGLCGGLKSQLLCGALSGGACMISLFAPKEEAAEMVRELVQWFQEVYGEAYGGTDCGQIIGPTRANAIVCPGLIESTYLQAKAILEDHGFDFDLVDPI